MALTDVINRLAEVNEEQLLETQNIRIEIETLSDRMGNLLELNKQDRLDRLESMREGAGLAPISMTAGDAGGAAAKSGGGGLLGGLMNGLMGFFGLKGFLASLQLFSGKLLKLFKGVGKFLGPLGLIITAIIGTFAAVEGFLKGYEEDGLIGGIEGAVKGLIGELVAKPLDLVRELAAWLARQFGFAKVSAFLQSFSFVEIYDKLLTGLFDVVEVTVDFIKGIFTNPIDTLTKLWDGLKNLLQINNIVDLLYLPVNLAVRWIQERFQWGDPDEPFMLSTFLADSINGAVNWFLERFGFGDPDNPFRLSSFIENMIANTVQLFTNIFQGLINKLRSIPILSKFFKSDREKALDAEIKALKDTLNDQQRLARDIQGQASPTSSIIGSLGYQLIQEERQNFVAQRLFLNPLMSKEDKDAEIAERIAASEAKKQELRNQIADVERFATAARIAAMGTQQQIRNAEIERQQIQTGMAVQQLNAAAGAAGGGTTIIYQTTNNVSGGGSGATGGVGVSSSTAAASNDYLGTLDATQVISGSPSR